MSGIFCPLTILESNVLSRNITFYWRKTCRQLNRRKKKKKTERSWNCVCLKHRSTEVLLAVPPLFCLPRSLLPSSPANAACQLHHHCAHIAVLWLANDMAVQPNSCWDPDHHVPTTIKKNTRVKPKHPNPCCFSRCNEHFSMGRERNIFIYRNSMNYAQT